MARPAKPAETTPPESPPPTPTPQYIPCNLRLDQVDAQSLRQDRGRNRQDVLTARIDRLAPPGAPARLNYKLKHLVPQLLGIGMVDYPGNRPMDVLPYEPHVRYLTSDLLGTRALYDHLLLLH